MVIVDTSIWIDHFRKSQPELARLLKEDLVRTHPFIIGELACGTIKNRQEILGLLARLPRCTEATHVEVLSLLETKKLFGKGIGWVDAHLLASALLTRASIWTRDKRFAAIATELDVRHDIK